MKAKCQNCSNEFNFNNAKAREQGTIICPSCNENLELPSKEDLVAHSLGLEEPISGQRIVKHMAIYTLFILVPAYFLLKYGIQNLMYIILLLCIPVGILQYKSMSKLDQQPITLRKKSGT